RPVDVAGVVEQHATDGAVDRKAQLLVENEQPFPAQRVAVAPVAETISLESAHRRVAAGEEALRRRDARILHRLGLFAAGQGGAASRRPERDGGPRAQRLGPDSLEEDRLEAVAL